MKTLLFIDDECRILQGLERQLHSMRHEWEMHFVQSGAAALEHLGSNPVDVIITDMLMPGMDGADLLEEVLKRHPNVVRLVLSGHADREAVMRLVGPAHQYLSKPCNAEELRQAITRTLVMRELLGDSRLRTMVSSIRSLPVLPGLHAELSRELLKEDPSIERVGEIISKDIGMTTRVLQLVNSAFFGLPQPAATVADAVMYLGLVTVRTLVLSLQVFSQFNSAHINKFFSLDDLVQHSWQTGVFARRIAEMQNPGLRIDNQCFLAGMLHDVGHLILASQLPEPYSRVLGTVRETGRPVDEVEFEQLGATHAQIGAYLLALWGVPMPVVEAVALHHHPASSRFAVFSPVTAVHAADVFTCVGKISHPEPLQMRVDDQYLKVLGLGECADEWREKCWKEDAA